MRILEIQNTEQIRPILEQVSISTRSLPSMIIFAATSKTILFLILNVFIVFVFPPAVWRVCKENEEIIKTVRKIEIQQEPVGTISSRRHDVNVTVTQVEPAVEEETQGQSKYDSQPPFNPYMTSSRKQETHF